MTALYSKAKQRFLEGAINWLTDNIKLVLVDTNDYTVNLAAHEFLSDIPVGARVATSGNLTGKTTGLGIADADDVDLLAVTGDQSEAVVIYKDTGVAGTSPLIAYIDVGTGLPVSPGGGTVTIAFSNGASRIFSL